MTARGAMAFSRVLPYTRRFFFERHIGTDSMFWFVFDFPMSIYHTFDSIFRSRTKLRDTVAAYQNNQIKSKNPKN